jgi:hypothetical protein
MLTGNLIKALQTSAAKVMKANCGAQLKLGEAPRAYRVLMANGTAVLCDGHLDAARAAGTLVAVTGETFSVNMCDACLFETGKEHQL